MLLPKMHCWIILYLAYLAYLIGINQYMTQELRNVCIFLGIQNEQD